MSEIAGYTSGADGDASIGDVEKRASQWIAACYFSLFLTMTGIVEEPIAMNFSQPCMILEELYRFNILTIVEPRVSSKGADTVIQQLKFGSSFRVEAQGRYR